MVAARVENEAVAISAAAMHGNSFMIDSVIFI
jgi:hypothetical protein